MPRLAASLLVPAVALLAGAAPAVAEPGDLDRRYGSKGVATSKLLEGATAGALDRQGRVLVAGGGAVPGVARLTASGRRDRRFGVKGVALDRGADASFPFAVRRERSGQILVGASSAQGPSAPVQLLRFGATGRRPARIKHTETFLGPIGGGLLRPDGGAIVWDGPYAYGFFVGARLRGVRADGAVDRSFGGDGTVEVCPERYCAVSAVAADPADGSLLVAVTRESSPSRILRLRPDGTVDPGFGAGTGVDAGMRVTALHVARSGRILAAGASRAAFKAARIVALTRAGAPVRSFGRAGVAQAGYRPLRVDLEVKDIAADGRGRPYVLVQRSDRRPAILRLTPGGRPYGRFGNDGSAYLPRPKGPYDTTEGQSLLLDRRGGLLVLTKLLGGGSTDPLLGCGYRDDLCASTVRMGVWRLRR
jgi:hypothetical protein